MSSGALLKVSKPPHMAEIVSCRVFQIYANAAETAYTRDAHANHSRLKTTYNVGKERAYPQRKLRTGTSTESHK